MICFQKKTKSRTVSPPIVITKAKKYLTTLKAAKSRKPRHQLLLPALATSSLGFKSILCQQIKKTLFAERLWRWFPCSLLENDGYIEYWLGFFFLSFLQKTSFLKCFIKKCYICWKYFKKQIGMEKVVISSNSINLGDSGSCSGLY